MIYIIREGTSDRVKIGYSRNSVSLRCRLKSLQTSNPSKLVIEGTMPGSKLKERCLHHFAINRHIRGEWFRLNKNEVSRLIAKYRLYTPTSEGIGKMPEIAASSKKPSVRVKALATIDPNQETPFRNLTKELREKALRDKAGG